MPREPGSAEIGLILVDEQHAGWPLFHASIRQKARVGANHHSDIFSAAPAGRQAPGTDIRDLPAPRSALLRKNLILPEYRDSPENAAVQRIRGPMCVVVY